MWLLRMVRIGLLRADCGLREAEKTFGCLHWELAGFVISSDVAFLVGESYLTYLLFTSSVLLSIKGA